jgi:putative transcriptional regulator
MNLNLDIFKIRTNNLSPRKGRVLIAEPFLSGSYFNRSIVLLVDHNKIGSVGFILNKPVDYPVTDFDKEFPGKSLQLYIGGPVSIDSMYYIHTIGKSVPNSIHVADNLYWGGDYEYLKNLINTNAVDPDQVRFFVGYSGWDAGQLQQELNENSWLVSDITVRKVMEKQDELWVDMVKKQGGKYMMWENFPENPSMN